MNPKLKAVIGIVVAAFIGLVVWAVQSIPDPTNVEIPQHVMSYDGNTITATKDGKIIWELKADTIEVVAETRLATMTNVKCRYYTEDGNVLELDSDKGIYNEATDDIELRDNIIGKRTDGYEMSCKELKWISKESKMILSGDVILEKKNEKLLAKGDVIEATDEFNKLKITGKAHLSKNMTDTEATGQ